MYAVGEKRGMSARIRARAPFQFLMTGSGGGRFWNFYQENWWSQVKAFSIYQNRACVLVCARAGVYECVYGDTKQYVCASMHACVSVFVWLMPVICV